MDEIQNQLAPGTYKIDDLLRDGIRQWNPSASASKRYVRKNQDCYNEARQKVTELHAYAEALTKLRKIFDDAAQSPKGFAAVMADDSGRLKDLCFDYVVVKDEIDKTNHQNFLLGLEGKKLTSNLRPQLGLKDVFRGFGRAKTFTWENFALEGACIRLGQAIQQQLTAIVENPEKSQFIEKFSAYYDSVQEKLATDLQNKQTRVEEIFNNVPQTDNKLLYFLKSLAYLWSDGWREILVEEGTNGARSLRGRKTPNEVFTVIGNARPTRTDHVEAVDKTLFGTRRAQRPESLSSQLYTTSVGYKRPDEFLQQFLVHARL